MKKIKRRAFLLIALVILLSGGVLFYCYSFVTEGSSWVAYASNKHLYANGQPILGTILDRDGEILAQSVNGKRVYHEDELTRRSLLHVIGDNAGNIGTGVQTKFAAKLTHYSIWSGLFNTRNGNLKLAVDADISRAALEALGDYKGAVIAYNYETGAILCAVSSHNYDPENVPENLESDSYYEGVYINRCFGALYAPGSVMKVVTAAAALETVEDLENMTFTCTGSCTIDGKTINCQNVHGTIDFQTALAHSCNCAFAEISQLVGAETLAAYFEKLGLADSLDISGIYTPSGSIDVWDDDEAELAWAGIGQSTDLVTPVSLLRMMGAIANGGTAVEPHLLASERRQTTKLLSSETAEALTELLRNNTATVYGDYSFPEKLSGCVCAKSGTAQVDGQASNSWFCGFCTGDYPCAFAVIAEGAGAGSGVAKDVAAAVLKAIVED